MSVFSFVILLACLFYSFLNLFVSVNFYRENKRVWKHKCGGRKDQGGLGGGCSEIRIHCMDFLIE